MAHYRSLRDLDWPLLIITLVICGMGILQIYSATHDTIWDDAWWKQGIWVLAGLVDHVGGGPHRLPHAA